MKAVQCFRRDSMHKRRARLCKCRFPVGGPSSLSQRPESIRTGRRSWKIDLCSPDSDLRCLRSHLRLRSEINIIMCSEELVLLRYGGSCRVQTPCRALLSPRRAAGSSPWRWHVVLLHLCLNACRLSGCSFYFVGLIGLVRDQVSVEHVCSH